MKLWTVAVDAPLPQALTYQLPCEEIRDLRGHAVTVPLGRRKATGVLLAPTDVPVDVEFKVKAIETFLEDRPVIPEPYLSWLEWLARYYAHPVGQVLSMAYPPLFKKTGRARKTDVVQKRESVAPPTLTPEQAHVYGEISKNPGFKAHLLFGVTGSGKTEVYLRLLTDVIASGKQAVVLVPEISLTPQLIHRFAERFGDQIAVIHSHLTEREKTNQWWEMVDRKKQILIGARSALFCPLPELGIIIVDEEHEPSFKQEEMLKYHARDAAIMLAKLANCPIILGSATPSMETWRNAREGKFVLHEMKHRVEMRPMPRMEVIDLKQDKAKRSDKNSPLPFWLGEKLYHAMTETLAAGDQVALFLNRRGMAQTVLCEACGKARECPNCSIGLTLHARTHLICHYCNYHENLTEICPECHQGEPKPLGVGTELIEQDLLKLFPEARVARADRDEIQSREDMEGLIERMEKREIDILVGTQMIAKGLDFPGLNLVGLVLADVGFNIPDFRASERAFQLITQVSGRAGRHVKGDGQGRVLIQTYNPSHPGITYSASADFVGFAEQELQGRKELNYPPYGKLASMRIQGLQHFEVHQASDQVRQRAEQLVKSFASYAKIEILGPVEAPLAKLRGKYRYQLLLKGPDAPTLSAFSAQLIHTFDKQLKNVKLSLDVDPYNLM